MIFFYTRDIIVVVSNTQSHGEYRWARSSTGQKYICCWAINSFLHPTNPEHVCESVSLTPQWAEHIDCEEGKEKKMCWWWWKQTTLSYKPAKCFVDSRSCQGMSEQTHFDIEKRIKGGIEVFFLSSSSLLSSRCLSSARFTRVNVGC